MKITAVIGARDEIELIGPALEHLRAIGVDHIVASDAWSTDGTAEVMAEAAKAPDVELMPCDDTDPGLDERVAAESLARARAAGSDWLLFCDADEFWLPATGTLKDCAELDRADVLTIPRYNVPLLPEGLAMPIPPVPARYADVQLYAPTTTRQEVQARVRADSEAAWIASIPAAKILTRTEGVASVAAGGHRAKAAGERELREVTARDVVIAHVPFSTEARFARKVENIARLVEILGHRWGANSAWHWRRWLDNVTARGGVAAEMARNTITADELAAMRAEGVVKSAAELLAGAQRAR